MSGSEPTGVTSNRYPEQRPRAATVRSRLMIEVASELVGRTDFGPKQARISFRHQGADSWAMSIFGSDALSTALEVAAGNVDFAILNPATVVSKAILGNEPFIKPVPLRAIATVPSQDRLGVAISTQMGLRTLEQVATERLPLRVSLRGQRPDHSVHAVVDDALAAHGITLQSIRQWGGAIKYHPGIPHQEPRSSAIRRGEVDLIIDEGIYNWVDVAIDAGFEFISFGEDALSSLEADGYRRSVIAADDYELLDGDVATVDFSGFLIYTHARVDDEIVTAFCESLNARRDRIPWQGGAELPLERMVIDAPDAPIPIEFHPAADAYWRGLGYLR